MFSKIVVALDSAQATQWIFEQALAIANTVPSQLALVQVLSPEDIEGYAASLYTEGYSLPTSLECMELYLRHWQELQQRQRQDLEDYARAAVAIGIPAQIVQPQGSPGKCICEFARSWQADLIVMGRRGLSGLSELFLGSVSNYVLHYAPCAVLILHRDSGASPQIPKADHVVTEQAQF
ncbi:MAG TPA: universal stress protein [Stenomitos sp.]